MNDHIIEYLDYYIELNNPQYAVMLKGNWGCGKTFFIKKQIERWKEEVVVDTDKKGDIIYLKPIYVSLNGISKVRGINQKIRAEINPFLYSKGMKIGKKVLNGLLKTALRIDLDSDSDGNKEGSVSFSPDSIGLFKNGDDIVKGKRILIFDDLERCTIDTDEVFGYINEFVEHYGCKVILLTDEEKIKRKYLVEVKENKEKDENDLPISYKDFKEKLVGQTFEVKSDIDAAISFFIEESKKLHENEILSKNKNLVIDVFNASKLENLRVLKQGLLDYGRFINEIDDKYKEHHNYNVFLKSLLCYFNIVYLEYKTGNEKVKKLDSDISALMKGISSDSQTKNKYRGVINKYAIKKRSSMVFSCLELFNYIDKGFISEETMDNILSVNSFFKEEKPQNWEDLWAWKLLDDITFKKLSTEVRQTFFKREIEDSRALFHISGIFLDLVDNELIDLKKSYIKKNTKAILKNIQRKNKLLPVGKVFRHNNSSLGKKYVSYDSLEFQELKDFYIVFYNKEVSKSSKNYIGEVFESLESDNVGALYQLLDEPVIDKTVIYNQTSFLSTLNSKIIAKKIKRFTPGGINDFGYFIRERYYPSQSRPNKKIELYHREELVFIREFKKELALNHKKREPIKNIALKEFDEILERVIALLEAEDS